MVKSNLHPGSTKPCVLIIDDEEAVRVTLRAILQTDYDILEADCAEKALEILKREHADLITLDVRMPGGGGLEALRAIRDSDEYVDTPVIMITGHASLDSACEAFRLGATDYLEKPFGIDELKTSVRNGLRRHSVPLPDVTHAMGSHDLPSQTVAEKKEVSRENLARLGKASAAFVHDLSSPLQVLTILNSLCTSKLTSAPSAERDQELREALEQMERLLSWSAELVKGWQTIAVPTEFSREWIDVQGLLEKVEELIQPYARLNGVTLTRVPLPRLMEVYGDRVQLERALVNISLNGIKASTTRGRTLEIGAMPFNGYHVFRFCDTGAGFSYERMKEVLNGDPFVSSGKSRRGLGLFIADWIAVNHGGKLQFVCEKGLGTTVEFFVPDIPKTVLP
jgi:DNA-binding response OmpR family regulator